LLGFPDAPDSPARAGEFLAPRDAVRLLQLMGVLGSLRSDPRAWRQELLNGLLQALPAATAAAFVLRGVTGPEPPMVVSLFDAGFNSEPQRQAFLREFGAAAFHDPFSRLVLHRFVSQQLETLTCLRADLIDDPAWQGDVHVLTHRKASGMGDCVMSVRRGAERGAAYVLLAFRAAVSAPPEGGADPGVNIMAAARFGPRERMLIDILHRGLDWLYRAEDAAHRLNRATALPPRLRETLEYLLGGDTERQVALKMSLSVHTVHDYVKALHSHFGVSSRTELLAKWLQTGGQMPPPREG